MALVTLALAVTESAGVNCPRQIVFEKSLQTLGNTRTMNMIAGDIDLDGDIDVFVPNYIGSSSLWLNDGHGTFSLSPQSFPLLEVHGAAIADFNGDTRPDIFVLSHASPSRIFFGNADGSFTMGSQQIGIGTYYPGTIVVGDVENDGDPDAFISYYTLPNRLWLNDGNGEFTITGTLYGDGSGNDMELADYNGDNFIDLFITFADRPDEIWLNNGFGDFINSGQTLGNSSGYENSACGDVDGDGDVDLAVANSVDGAKVFLNQNNSGLFVDATPYFEAGTPKIEFLDADADGDLDLVTAHRTNGAKLWVNDGSTNFAQVSQFVSAWAQSIACADLDGDTDPDLVLGVVENSGGNPIFFNRSVDTCHSSVTDVDGNVYGTITIGTQVWMAENLKVTHYRNSEAIPDVTDPTAWANLSTGASCAYDNDAGLVATYGRLYNWHAVADSRNIAPLGWHVATDADWKLLEIFLGMSQTQADSTGWRGTVEGGKLKETETTHWVSPNVAATNETEFSGLPGGYRYEGGAYDGIGLHGVFWTSSEISSGFAWTRGLGHVYSGIHRFDGLKVDGFSVRCVKNASCCDGFRGNANGDPDDKVNISDVSFLVSYLFGIPTGPAPSCPEEGNANGDPDEKTNVSDLTYLIAYLFAEGPGPARCPGISVN